MKIKAAPFLLLIPIILVAGCTGGGGSQGPTLSASGVVFKDFSPVTLEVYAGNNVNLYLQVQNNGYFDAEDVSIELYNCGRIRNDVGGNPVCGEEYNLGDLTMPDLDRGVAGETAEKEFVLSTSNVEFKPGRSTHVFSARMEYTYRATASKDVVLTSFQNWREKAGNIEVGALAAESTPTPVTVMIKASDRPIILSDPSLPQNMSVTLTIANQGMGNIPQKTIDYVKVCYNTEMLSVSDYLDFNVGGHNNVTGCLRVEDKELIGLQQQWKDLDVKFETKDLREDFIQDITSFSAEVGYKYSTDTTTAVTIVN